MDEKIDGLPTEDLRNLIKSVVLKMGSQFTKEEKKEHARMLIKIFEKGMTPKEVMEITDEEISQIYSYAYHLFSGGKYLEARELFKMLVLLEPRQGQFATALGVCFHRLKEYDNALSIYMLSAILLPSDPVPLFYAYDCFMKLNEPVSAGIMLCNVISRAGDQKSYAKIKEDAQKLLEELEKQIVGRKNSEARIQNSEFEIKVDSSQ